MLTKHSITLLVIALLFSISYVSWPVYQAMAHKGKVDFLPFHQFIDIPYPFPTQQEINNKTYQQTGTYALQTISAHAIGINAPGISAAVAIDGQLVWAGAAGWASIESSIPVNTDTQFRVGSTSKALTGTALARMVDAKQIELDNPIAKYLISLPNEQWHNITPRQLASHTAGLPHYKDNSDYLGLYRTLALATRYEQVKDALTIFDNSALLFTPGTQFSYSTFGTVLLSAAMAGAADKSYLEIMQNQVFTPLDMAATKAEFQANSQDNLATFYWNNKGRNEQVRKWRDVDLSHRLAGGGFISTSSDLVKLGAAFLQDDFISAKTREMFWTPQVLPNGDETPNGYALGWRVITRKIDDTIGEITFANHGGVSRGAQSWLMVIPKYKMAVAVNINANTKVFWDFGKVSIQLAKMFIHRKVQIMEADI